MSFYVQGSKIRVDFLDFQTEGCNDLVILADGMPKREDLGYPFTLDQDSPICEEGNYNDYDYYYDDYFDYYDDYVCYPYKNDYNEEKQQNIEKVKKSGNNRRISSYISQLGNHGTKSNSKKIKINKNNEKRRENKKNWKNPKNNKYTVSQNKGGKKNEAKRVLNRNQKKNQTTKKGSNWDKRKRIREKDKDGKLGKSRGKFNRKPVVKPDKKPDGKPKSDLVRVCLDPDQFIAVSHIFCSDGSLRYHLSFRPVCL